MNKSLLPDSIFIERFDKACELSGLNNTDLGHIMRCERKAISDYRNGVSAPTISRLKRFCQAFKVSADYLLGLEDKKLLTNERIEVEKLRRENEILWRGFLKLCAKSDTDVKRFLRLIELEYEHGISSEVNQNEQIGKSN